VRHLAKFAALLGLIIAGPLLGAAFGALHDQLSYTLGPEYFTRFKFVQFAWAEVGAMPPRLGAAVVGMLATWWVGLYAGICLAAIGLLHRHPADMVRITLRAYGLVALCAATLGIVGFIAGWLAFGSNESAPYVDWWRPDGLTSPRRFFAVGVMHTASYLGGALGVLLAAVYQVRVARRARRDLRREGVVAPAV
jgi:hypothetical protein